jgi:hypothetical protein
MNLARIRRFGEAKQGGGVQSLCKESVFVFDEDYELIFMHKNMILLWWSLSRLD